MSSALTEEATEKNDEFAETLDLVQQSIDNIISTAASSGTSAESNNVTMESAEKEDATSESNSRCLYGIQQ